MSETATVKSVPVATSSPVAKPVQPPAPAPAPVPAPAPAPAPAVTKATPTVPTQKKLAPETIQLFFMGTKTIILPVLFILLFLVFGWPFGTYAFYSNSGFYAPDTQSPVPGGGGVDDPGRKTKHMIYMIVTIVLLALYLLGLFVSKKFYRFPAPKPVPAPAPVPTPAPVPAPAPAST